MTLSLNEIEQTVAQAAAGRGLDHGVAAELGAAARWMCAHGHDGVAAAHRALAAGDRTPEALGLTAVDLELCGESSKPRGTSPPLLVGLRGRAGLEAAPAEATRPDAREPGAREPGAREPGAREPGAREPGAAWEAICAWAAITSVPSSDRSRRSGAGAGLTDND